MERLENNVEPARDLLLFDIGIYPFDGVIEKGLACSSCLDFGIVLTA
jgi:hypothetical protein